MSDRDDRGDRHLPLEEDRDVGRDHDEEHDERLDRLVGDVVPPGRPDILDRHRRCRLVSQRGEHRRHLGGLLGADAGRVLGELRLDVQAFVAPAPELGDRRASEAERRQRALCLRRGDARCRDLPGSAPYELDAVVEALRAERGEARDDHDRGGAEPPSPPADEVETGLSVVQAEEHHGPARFSTA